MDEDRYKEYATHDTISLPLFPSFVKDGPNGYKFRRYEDEAKKYNAKVKAAKLRVAKEELLRLAEEAERERQRHMYSVPKWDFTPSVSKFRWLGPTSSQIGEFVLPYYDIPLSEDEERYFDTPQQAKAYRDAYFKKYHKLNDELYYSPNGFYPALRNYHNWIKLPLDAEYDMNRAFRSKEPIIFDPQDERKGDLPFENRWKLAEDLGLGHEVNHIADMYRYHKGGRLIPRRFKLK